MAQLTDTFWRSISTSHGPCDGSRLTDMILALTMSVSRPNSTVLSPSVLISTYAARSSFICCVSTLIGAALLICCSGFTSSSSPSVHCIFCAPQPSCIWPKQCIRGLLRRAARSKCWHPTCPALRTSSRMPIGGPWVIITSISGQSGTGFSAMGTACGVQLCGGL